MCTTTTCGKETTWRRTETIECQIATSPKCFFHAAGYTCVLCGANSLIVLYRNLDWSENPLSKVTPKSWSYKAVQKIGQVPPQSIAIPADLSDRLGATAGHYKKALVCRTQNFGIGAMAYMRRVVEEKTEELIDVVVELARTYGVDSKIISSLEQAKKQVRYEDKLKVASELIPSALRPGDVNPLGQLYTHLSIGLHGKTDDECVAIFDDLKDDFEYIFRNLHVEAKERREFVERVQKRASRNP
jgi:hypothetical protein